MQSDLQNICVYCASSAMVDDVYKSLAEKFGARLAAGGRTLVYGGGHVGLMGVLADAALAGGGHVVGVIPTLLMDKEVAHTGLTELHITEDMQSRQLKMAELSDAFVVLPGGLGTLAEFFEIVTWKQLGLHDKPIFIVNTQAYWDDLIAMMQTAQKQNFLRQDPDDLFTVVSSLEDLSAFVF